MVMLSVDQPDACLKDLRVILRSVIPTIEKT